MGTVDSPWATAVDPSGLVTQFGPGAPWSLDWWIGADDRWHFPSVDAGVRQHLVGGAPVVETLVRIPGGDAVQRVFGIRGASFAGGDEWVVVEVENRSAVPFAVAFAVRPVTPEGLTSVTSITMAPAAGDGHDAAQAVDVDGRTVMVLGRRPARIAAANAPVGDVADIVRRGDASELSSTGSWAGSTCPDGLAQAAFVFPVAHTATVRVVLPIGAEARTRPGWPAVIPPAVHVAAGWDAHTDRAMRMEVPDLQLAEAVAAARRSLMLAPWSEGVRHVGPHRKRTVAGHDLVDTGRIVTALDRLGHHDEVARTLQQWPEVLASLGGAPEDDAAVVDAIATHRLLAGDQHLFDDLLPDVVASVSRLDRAASRGRLAAPDRRAAVRCLTTLAAALDASGQPEGGAEVRSVLARMTSASAGNDVAGQPVEPREILAAAIDALTTGQVVGADLLQRAVAAASATFAFASAGEPHDLVAAALLLDAVRALLVQESADGLDLLTVFPPGWYGGAVELHDAPTVHGRLSYAVRWHGTRPALLWELDGSPTRSPIRIAVPGLDPGWSTTKCRGEALLGEVAPPVGLPSLRVVTEHPGDGATFV
ncbi:MAG: hypothetical protein M3Z46_00410 [Actinomycetota bacterium]|nr:hypothetical protein [Actinomycetota bacterium]